MINYKKFKSKTKYKLYRHGVFDKVKPSQLKRNVINRELTKEVMRDLYENHDYSWARTIYELNKDNLDSVAITYRGNKITYKEYFDKADYLVSALVKSGVKEGDIIPCCIGNTPELVYLMRAASILGVKLNIFGPSFDEDYITEIINESTCGIMFINDYNYEKIKGPISKSKVNKIVNISLVDSLKNGIDPYDEIDRNFLEFKRYPVDDNRCVNFNDFCNVEKVEVEDVGKLDTPFTITYTSGSTGGKRPKQILHSTKSYVAMGRFHNNDLSGLPNTKNTVALAHIPPYSNTNLTSAISDVFFQNGTVAMEPIYDPDFFYYSIQINKPNFVLATKSFWVHLAKKIVKPGSHYDLSSVKIPTVVGEGMEPGAEKLINKALRKAKAGTKELPFPLCTIVTACFGGGGCEIGGLFFTLFRETLRKLSGFKKEIGMTPFKLADCTVLRENGEEADVGEIGRIVSNSPCTMLGYVNNPDANAKFWITDSEGRRWADNGVYGYMDSSGKVHIKDRYTNKYKISDECKYPLFEITDAIACDSKNILMCETVFDAPSDQIVINLEMQPDKKSRSIDVIKSADNRIRKKLPYEIYSRINYRVKNNEESFPMNPSGKRDVLELKEEKLTNCFRVIDGRLYDTESLEKGEVQEYSNTKVA